MISRHHFLVIAGILISAAAPTAWAAAPQFYSSHSLLLLRAQLPKGMHYRSSFTQYSVDGWDSGIKQLMSIDESFGWLEASQEKVLDRAGHQVGMSVQLFRSSRGALGDFGQFFTNQHPETIYVPGSTWLGGTAVRGLGDRATVYRISDSSSRCPSKITSGVSFVYRNGIFSVSTCTRTAGEQGALDLAKRMLDHARSKGR